MIFLLVDVVQAALQKLEQHIDRRYVEIGIVAIAGVQVRVRDARPGFRRFPIILDCKLKIVVGGVRDFKDAGEPHVDVVRDAR